jgi:hypothetical protein
VPAIFACDTRKGKSYQYHLRKSHDVIEMRVSEEDRLGSDAVRANRIQERLWIVTCVDDPSRSKGVGLNPFFLSTP